MRVLNTMQFFYTTGKIGTKYSKPEEIAAFLIANDLSLDEYIDTMWRTARGMMSAGDFQSPREMLDMMLSAAAIVRKHHGLSVLE